MSEQMRREIAEQPAVLSETLRNLDALSPKLRSLPAKKYTRVLFIARGTSDNVAAYGLFLVPKLAGIEAYSLSPSLLNAYSAEFDLSSALVVAISQSGETQEIVDAAVKAKELGATVVAITNNLGSSLEKASEVCLVTQAGKELAVPATKTYSSALLALAWGLAQIFVNDDVLKLLARMPEFFAEQLRTNVVTEEITAILASSKTCVIAGRGFAMGAAFEAALKLKETSGINAIGTSVADLVHGPIAALSSEVPLIALSASEESPVYPGVVDLIQRAKSLGAPIIAMGEFRESDVEKVLRIPIQHEAAEIIAPLIFAVPSQLLAASVADARGVDADSPAGLRKVTQTV